MIIERVKLEASMTTANTLELTCTRWLAQICLQGGNKVQVYIHRGSPISEKDALKAARQTAKFGKVGSLLPIGPCQPRVDEDH